MHQKYFIAIVPPEPVLSHITDIKQNIYQNHGTKGALRSPAHITLHMPFSWEENKEQKLIDCLQEFKSTLSFNIELNGFDCFEPRVLFINVIQSYELNNLQIQLVKCCKQKLQLFNQVEDMRGFHPHITVAFRDLKKPTFYNLWNDYQHKEFKASFINSSFCLMKQEEQQWVAYREFN